MATAVLDIGCGEGYYTHAFADALPEITTFGLDVSKVAIKAAAKRYPQVTFCVASSHRLPFSDTSMDAIIRIYAPCRESRRISASSEARRLGHYCHAGTATFDGAEGADLQ